MVNADVIIIGGGPAGSSCAWRLKQNNVNCIILDQHSFPRNKPCAGWITPEVIQNLDFKIQEYPFSFTTFTSFLVSIRRFRFKLPTQQYAIRRYEFDAWLLNRSAAPHYEHLVKTILPVDGGYSLDGEFFGKYLIGAGGTHCPVYRTLFQPSNPKLKSALIVAQEEEFPYEYTDPHCQLWFLENHLPGYSWYVPKTNGFVNVGVGGNAEQLKARGDTLKNHWNFLIDKLDKMGIIHGHTYHPSGHSYYLRQNLPQFRKDNAFVIGDAAGLATLDMGEGISPAIQSGLLAADAILHGTDYSPASISRYSLRSLVRLGASPPAPRAAALK